MLTPVRRPWCLLLAAAATTAGCCRGSPTGPIVPEAPPPAEQKAADEKKLSAEKEWYTPLEADFRTAYQAGAANQPKQTWDQYWDWVKTFYSGTLLASGWTAQGQDVLGAVQAEATRDELRAELNALGRRIAAEWAKDNQVRKLDTTALRGYSGRIRQARKEEDGTGGAVRRAVADVLADVDRKLGR